MRRKRKTGFVASPAHASQGRVFGGTSAYLMGVFGLNPLDWFKSKWGISDTPDLRRGQVDRERPGMVYTLFQGRLLWGWVCEQLVHFFYQRQNAPFRSGTGKTEWFWNFNPIFGSCFLYFTVKAGFVYDWQWYAGAYILPFVWLDGLLWLVFFWMLRWLLLGGALVGAGYFVWLKFLH